MMNAILNKRALWAGAFCALLALGGCQTLTEINENPNNLTDERVNPAYVLTSVLSTSGTVLSDVSFSGNVTQAVLSEAMQYTQRDFLEFAVTNQFGWYSLPFDYRNLHQPLANAAYLERRAVGNPDSLFIKGTSLTMQSMWYGFYTSVWGDIPYSEANLGTANLQPVFDPQKDVFVGILKSLDQANSYFKQAGAVKSSVLTQSDILYKGDVMKWRKFANSLRLRFLVRLSEKQTDMSAAGVDIKGEVAKMVSDPTNYPLITASEDNAAITYPGTNTIDSWRMGGLIKPTLSEFYRIKSAATIVNFLKEQHDPRLSVFFRPVEVQTLVRDKGAEKVIAKDETGAVKRFVKQYTSDIDTSLYVGLKIALENPDIYNQNNAADRTAALGLNASIYNSGAANPFVSYLSAMYRENKHPLVKTLFVSASEVNFLLAEAAARNWITGSAQDYYWKGIASSLTQYGISDGDAKVYNTVTHEHVKFNLTAFQAQMKATFASASNPIEEIVKQKWASNFTTVESWFDWRRTGFPAIGQNIISGAQGSKIPVRYVFGESELNYNPENVAVAISRLEPAVNDQWSKMWLIQGTGKPW
jgi:hypothetical protein